MRDIDSGLSTSAATCGVTPAGSEPSWASRPLSWAGLIIILPYQTPKAENDSERVVPVLAMQTHL